MTARPAAEGTAPRLTARQLARQRRRAAWRDGWARFRHSRSGMFGLVVLVLVMANLRKPRISQGLWALLLVLTLANVCVAVFWSSAHGR